MQKVVAVVLVALALACASVPSRTTITPINGTVVGTITNVAGDTNALAPVLYSLWVPENAAAIEFSVLNTNNDDCYYIDLFLLSYGAPCVDDTFNIDGDAFCLMRTYAYSGSYEVDGFYTPGYNSGYFVARTGQYVYIGVSTESAYNAEICTYSFTAVVNTTCAAGQIATSAYSSDEWTCSTPVRGNLNNFTATYTNVSTTDYIGNFYFPVAQGTGSVTFTIQSTEDLYVYGASNYGASENRYDCYTSTTSNGNSNYTLSLTCVYPESGYFSFQVVTYFPDNDFFTYTLTTSVNVCNATTGGYMCTWDAYALDYSNLQTINIGIPYVSQNNGVDKYTYFYIDVPANATFTNAVQVNVALGNTTGNEDAYVVYSKNSYPDYDHYIDSDQYDYISINQATSWVLSFHDFIEASRIYLGIYCYDGTVCNITITFTAVGPIATTTTTTGTTVSGTTVSGTTVSSTTVSGTTVSSTTVSGTTVSSTTVSGTTVSSTSTSSNVTITTNSAAGLIASFVVMMVALLF